MKSHRRFRVLAIFILAVSPFASFVLISPPRAADPPPAKKSPSTEFECRWTDTPISIDGKADEEAWKHAQVIDHFYLPWLQDKNRPAKTATKAKLLWDREYLYFFADMEDTDLYADVTEHNGQTWDNDCFELFFKPAEDKPGYYEFQVNAAGTVFDCFFPRRGAGGARRFKNDTEFHVEAKVKLDGTLNNWTDKDKGWAVEGRIPWKDFYRTGGRPAVGEKWKFALCRYDYSIDFEGPELSTCAPLKSQPFPDFHHFEDYATLKFVGPNKATSRPHGIEKLVPLTTSTVVGSPDPPPPYRVERVYPKLKLNFPICVRHQPGSDRIWLIDETWSYGPTRLARFKDDPNVEEIETLLPLQDVAYDICFHPKFADNGYVYVGSNGPHPSGTKHTRVTRYTVERKPPYKFDPKSAVEIISWESDGHNGGAITFGHDSMMYVTSGDGNSDSDTNVAGQRMDLLLSKVLRIDVDHPDPNKTYSILKDNPFVGMKDVRPETWAVGLRNPWRMTTDAKTGHIWVGQNGQDLWEQAFLVHKGDNYGWSVMEGSHPFYLNRKLAPVPLTLPTIEHHHSEFRSLTGGIVYYGKKFSELNGAYLYGDYSTGKIWAMKHDGAKPLWHKELADSHLAVTSFATDSKGEILITHHFGKDKGGIFTLEPTPKDLPPSKFPRKLSDSGLFQSVKGHVMIPALIPYSVNSALWSDGAYKERWLGLPGDNPHFDFSQNRGWNLPEKTVIVKSFALEMEAGNPASRKWIETRFLTKQDGEWYGYSYLWNDEQTEGTLVEANGLDRDYTIHVPKSAEHPDGLKVQKWRYPSRAECMVCHSRAANWVLGLTELQMNKEHDYHGVRDNQLRVLEHLGILRVNWADDARTAIRDELQAKGAKDKALDEKIEKLTATRNQREPRNTSMLSFNPENYKKLVDPYDPKQDLDKRARSYLHANCAQCHVEAGGGNAQMDLEFTTDKDKVKIFDVRPVHNTYGLLDAKLIAPGHPERSVLLLRLSHRGEGHMPPLATNEVDTRAVEMLRAWIAGMK
ncbi:MAG TPA: carbohydrate-binding family 9-like protein [Gemmataceae bacterium]|jgi:glucose/arabinose dehydrogenase|nr:carbohydrate-binding family 9-like protein [Gemmataceae bacterium]